MAYRGIWNLTIKNSDFGDQISNGLAFFAMGMVPTFWKPDRSKSGHFFRISNGFWHNRGHLSGFQMVGASGFQITFKIGTICNPISFLPFKIQISDFHCICIVGYIRTIEEIYPSRSCTVLPRDSGPVIGFRCGVLKQNKEEHVKYCCSSLRWIICLSFCAFSYNGVY